MLKKMRWRFIGAAMAAFTAVVLTLLCFVNLWNYHSVTDQQDEALLVRHTMIIPQIYEA